MSPVPPPVITTVPLAGWVTALIVLGPASMSVSLANTVIAVAAASSSTVAVSLTATGGSSTQVTVTDTVAVVAAGERVGERVRGPAGLAVAVVGVGLVGEPGAAAGDHDGAVGRLGDRADRLRAAVDVGVIGQHVDRGGGGVLEHGGGVVDGDRGSSTQVTVTDTVAVVAAVERVGERVRGPAGLAVAVVGVGLVGEPGAAAGDHHGAVGRLGHRGDRDRVALDVGVVGQHVHRGGGGVLEHRGGVVDGDRGVVDTGDGHRHRGGGAAWGEGVGERVRGAARPGCCSSWRRVGR